MENKMHVDKIFIYPVKSMAGYAVEQATADENGFLGDRQFVVTNSKGKFLTARQLPKLLTLQPTWNDDYSTLKINGPVDEIFVDYPTSSKAQDIQVWKDSLYGVDCGDDVAMWLSHILGKEVRLMTAAVEAKRKSAQNQHVPNNYADSMPLMVMSQATIDEINRHIDLPVTWRNFRPNILVSGVSNAFAEDYWEKIKIGTSEMQMVHGCARCVMTTIDPHTGVLREDREPMLSLRNYRRFPDKQIYVGQHGKVTEPSLMKSGDLIKVITNRPENILMP